MLYLLHSVRMPYPVRKSDGFIDSDEVFKWAIYRLKIPINHYDEFLEKYSFFEFGLLVDAYFEDKKDYFEGNSYAFRVGYYNAKTGKNIKLYEDNNKQTKQATEKERQETLDYLDQMFT